MLPLAAALLGRAARDVVRRTLGLEAARRAARPRADPRSRRRGSSLLGLAAAQPALAHRSSQRVRKDVQALFVLDTSRSMAASATATSPTRLDRAIAAAVRLRAAIPEVPSGVATLTDRVLPDLLPVADIGQLRRRRPPRGRDREPAAAGLERSRDRPTPRSRTSRSGNYFDPAASRRIVVLLTDGESNPVDAGEIARDAAGCEGLPLRLGSLLERRRVGLRRQGQAGGRLPARTRPGARCSPGSPPRPAARRSPRAGSAARRRLWCRTPGAGRRPSLRGRRRAALRSRRSSRLPRSCSCSPRCCRCRVDQWPAAASISVSSGSQNAVSAAAVVWNGAECTARSAPCDWTSWYRLWAAGCDARAFQR